MNAPVLSVHNISKSFGGIRAVRDVSFDVRKGEGYDVKTLRKVLRIRKQDRAKRQEEEAILDLYLSALGEV